MIAGALVIVAAALCIGLAAIADSLNRDPWNQKSSTQAAQVCGMAAALVGFYLMSTKKPGE
jgi:hypothetical protein